MKKRLSKIARELNASISDVAEFLRINGFDCDEDPNESFSEEIVEVIENNFPAFISEKRKEYQKQSPKSNKVKKEENQLNPLVDYPISKILKRPVEKTTGTKMKLQLQRTGVDFPEQELPLDPYFVGLWIAKGSKNKNDVSNDIGYFHTGKSFSCGISSCNTDYKIEFSKEGYNTKVINENFYSSSEAEFLNADKKDTLIIKLDKI